MDTTFIYSMLSPDNDYARYSEIPAFLISDLAELDQLQLALESVLPVAEPEKTNELEKTTCSSWGPSSEETVRSFFTETAPDQLAFPTSLDNTLTSPLPSQEQYLPLTVSENPDTSWTAYRSESVSTDNYSDLTALTGMSSGGFSSLVGSPETSAASSSGSSPVHAHALPPAELFTPHILREPSLKPYVIFLEPPNKKVRFRYKSEIDKESRPTGSIPGKSWSKGNCTHPKVKIVHPRRQALFIASCVTHDLPYRTHPHQLFGRDGENGVWLKNGMAVTETTLDEFELCKIGILRVLQNDIAMETSVIERHGAYLPQLQADQVIFPLQYGMASEYDLRVVRLAFQVFVRDDESQRWEELEPLVSEPIYNDNSLPTTDTKEPILIDYAEPTVGRADGGGDQKNIMVIGLAPTRKQKVKFTLKELEVIFYDDDEPEWREKANIIDIRSGIIVVRTPEYGGRLAAADARVPVWFQVHDAAHNASEPLPYHYTVKRHHSALHCETPPSESDSELSAKRVCQDATSNTETPANAESGANIDGTSVKEDSVEKALTERLGFLKL